MVGSSVWVGLPLGVWCRGVFGNVLWIRVGRFARGDARGVVMTLFRPCIRGIPSRCILGGEV
jgi:hypothetical protein